MTPLTTQKKHKKPTLPKLFDFDNEAFESAKEFASGVTGSVKKDLAEEGAKDLLHQLLGKYEKTAERAHKLAGDLQEGEEMDLSAQKAEPAPKRQDIAPGLESYNYHRDIIRSSERSHNKETREIESQVEEILVEIKRIATTTKELEATFSYASVDQKPAEVGKYHQTFFEWMLLTLRNARMKIEDSGAWLATMSGKKGKQNYWSMFKKHGTSFGLSNERGVATQTG